MNVVNFPAKSAWRDFVSFGRWQAQFRCTAGCADPSWTMTEFSWSHEEGFNVSPTECTCGAMIDVRSLEIEPMRKKPPSLG